MTARRRCAIGFTVLGGLAFATLLAAPSDGEAATLADLCAAAKLNAAAKFAKCRPKVESSYARSGATAKRDAAYVKCGEKFGTAYTRVQTKHGAACAASGEDGEVQAGLTESADTVTDLVAGVTARKKPTTTTTSTTTTTTLPDTCPADLQECQGDLASCNGSLGACTTSLATCNSDLGTCSATLGSTQASLTTCNDTLTTTRAALTTCQDDLAACQATTTTTSTSTTSTTTLPQTVIDPATGLMWELKRNWDGVADYGDPHDADNSYSWTFCCPWTWGSPANGTLFTDFFVKLNTPPCYAGHCDWRLPSIEELAALRDFSRPGCSERTAPCSTPLVDPTVTGWAVAYWSGTTASGDPNGALCVDFYNGDVISIGKTDPRSVRAVRGGT